MRVLIVEDVAAEAELAVRCLTADGMQCDYRVVETEPAFCDALREFRPDIILSDFTLPLFDGMGALDIANHEAPGVPFIFLSGTIGEERAIEALKRGAVDYVLKSNTARLAAAARRALREVAERRQQQERIARLTRVLQMQSGINAAVVRIRHRDALLREACRLARSVGGYDLVVVSLVDPDGQRARPWFRSGPQANEGEVFEFRISDGTEPDSSLVARALRTGEVTASFDLTCTEPPVAGRDALLAHGFKSLVALPLIVDGARIGVFSLASRSADLLSDEELLLLQEMMSNLSFALRYRQTEDAVNFLAYFDPLTGLAKRALFCERVDTRLRERIDPEGVPVVVAFDIDHLSQLNDSFGRLIGDQVLQKVAQRLKERFGDDEAIGYLGSGTFAIVLPEVDRSGDDVGALLETSVFRDAFQLDGRAIRVSCHSGTARFRIDGDDGSSLVQKAEAALKQAKEAGETALDYQVQMHSEIAERLAMEHRLRMALEEQQFVIHYQPQIDIATGRLEGVEALLRWNDPDDGLVLPGRFLHILESSGMIVPVGEWVLATVAADCRRWRDLTAEPPRIAVNVSAIQIRRRNFVERVLETLRNEPDCGIDLEITETSLLRDLDGTVKKLRELRAAGLRIALDDFGTGYSSLGLLSTLPVDMLKIDRSFIAGLPDDRASVTLVSSIIGLALAFDLKVVAEGVETTAQLEALRKARCHYSQGLLHSAPLPASELERTVLRPA